MCIYCIFLNELFGQTQKHATIFSLSSQCHVSYFHRSHTPLGASLQQKEKAERKGQVCRVASSRALLIILGRLRHAFILESGGTDGADDKGSRQYGFDTY